MNNEKEKAPLNNGEGAKSDDAVDAAIYNAMAKLLDASIKMSQLVNSEYQKTSIELEKTKAELEKMKNENSSQKSE